MTPLPAAARAMADGPAPNAADRTGAELPEAELSTAEGPMTLRRAWPVPHAAHPTLAVELDDGVRIRAGWFSAGQLRLVLDGRDPKLEDLEAAAANGVVVSHRPGKRAVVRSDDALRYMKIVKRGKAGRILDGLDRADAFAGSFRTPELLASSKSTVTFAALEGRSVHDPAHFTADQWRAAWTAIGDAWVTAVNRPSGQIGAAQPDSPAADPRALIHRAEAEAAVLRHWHQAVLPWLDDADSAAASVEKVSGLLAGLPEERLRPAHRDLHDKQLLYSEQAGPGLLDVDTACWADPGLDLGNLRAHALLRRMQGIWSAEQAETVRFCLDEAAQQIGAEMPTVAVYEHSALLRLGFVYAVRPQYAGVAAQLRQLAGD